jgi:Ca2+-binding RTX toxin-like protein
VLLGQVLERAWKAGAGPSGLGGLGALDYPVTVAAGTGNDRIRSGPLNDRLAGGPGNDTLDGAGGHDLISGGSGDDVIRADDGTVDRVLCGPGLDRVTTDASDLIAASCEIVNGQPRA